MGVAIGVIQRILGHQSRNTTEIYLHSVGDAERKAMNKLQEIDVFSKMEPSLLGGPINKSRPSWQRRVNRPPFEILKAEIEQMGYTAVGRKYGVSDNAVRKWMKAYSEPKGRIEFDRVEKSHTDSHTE